MSKYKLFHREACVECKRCIQFEKEMISSAKNGFPLESSLNVCPTNALTIASSGELFVEKSLCLGCGLCRARCPRRLLDIQRGELLLTKGNRPVNLKQSLQAFYERLPLANAIPNAPNILVRNALLMIGKQAGIRRVGDTILRIDGMIFEKEETRLLEIQFNGGDIETPRSVLDDYAIFNFKFNKVGIKTSCLIVLSSLPNKRSEFWRVISDIKKVLGIRVDIATVGALLSVVICGKTIPDLKTFADISHYSLRESFKDVVVGIDDLPLGYLSVFEANK